MDAEWDDPDDRWGDELDYQEEIAPDALDQVDRALLSKSRSGKLGISPTQPF